MAYCLRGLLILKIRQDTGSYLRSSISRISIFHQGFLGFFDRRFGGVDTSFAGYDSRAEFNLLKLGDASSGDDGCETDI
jgi:hypothetical protein